MSDNSNSVRYLSLVDTRNKFTKPPIPEETTLAERIAYGAADPFDWHFIHTILRLYPDRHAAAIARRYCAILSSKSRNEANTDLRTWRTVAAECGIAINADFQKIEELTEEKNNNALIALKWGGRDAAGQYRSLSRYCIDNGVTPPEPNENKGGSRTTEGCIKRMLDKNWWRKQLRKKILQERERIAVKLGLVSKKKDIYCSREAREDKLAQDERNERMLENLVATDGTVSISLAEVAKSTISNPEIRYAELMTRLNGFEQMLKEAGQETIFVTVTCPSRMHSVLSKSNRPNPKYDGTTPAEAHQYLQKTWEKTRAKLNRKEIQLEGYRIAEPHHDGCPHWHLALATDPEHKNELIEIIEDYFTQTDPNEKGIENRVKIELVRSIAGYLSKYVSKNIDGKHVDKDFHGHDAKAGAVNVRAWASLWNIRQFQPIGGASVTTYRELRRIRDPKQVPADMLDIWKAADAGDWAEYETLQGGLNTPKSTHKIKIAKAWSDQLNRFDERLGYITIGLEAGSSFLDTRPKIWTIETRNVIEKELNAALSEAMGLKVTSIEDFQTYAAYQDAYASVSEEHKNPCTGNNSKGKSSRVQLFTQGQVKAPSGLLAATAALQATPNAPPDDHLIPLDYYETDSYSQHSEPEELSPPVDYDDYANYIDSSTSYLGENQDRYAQSVA